ncbi:methyl-accepting chemotaxis protein [Bacillus sp. CGMCC 1.16607]|uniref:methyl-accepting chemotaxis protein n=1 Tax=Bacillus sp. CGMCC 1.16607 TaxID=3351842 RepID=UPI00362DD4BE
MGILRNLKVSRKLLFLLIISILASFIVGMVGISYTRNIAKESEFMYKELLMPNQWLGQVRINNQAIDAYTLRMMITTDQVEKDELNKLIKENIDEINTMIEKYEKIELLPEEIKTVELYHQQTRKLREARGNAVELAIGNNNDEAYEVYVNEVVKDRNEVNNLLEQLQQSNLDYANKQNQKNKENIRNATVILFGVILLTVVIIFTLGALISRIIVKPINDIKILFSQAEEGDFTVKGTYESKDEIGDLTVSFNNMMNGLSSIVENVRLTSQQVAAASEELTASANQTMSATEHVATAIQEIASGAETSSVKLDNTSKELREVLEGILRISDRSTIVSDLSKSTADESEEGSSIVDNNLTQMRFIHESVSKSNKVIESLAHRSQEIGKILDVIGDIAAQTNLLSLNAAIEAARAGEHGKGFAVVADEVRKLAEQSLASTKTIGDLITSIQRDTDNSVMIMKDVMEKAERGMIISTDTSNKFTSILEKTRDITPQIEDITLTVQQISKSLELISSSSNEMTLLAKSNAESSEEVAASAEEQLASMEEINSSSKSLSFMAEELDELVKKFKI